jgi:hypothetical protein
MLGCVNQCFIRSIISQDKDMYRSSGWRWTSTGVDITYPSEGAVEDAEGWRAPPIALSMIAAAGIIPVPGGLYTKSGRIGYTLY